MAYRTRQEIFDLAWKGLKAQGFERSVDLIGKCLYRGKGERKCALGHCIPDELYTPALESWAPTHAPIRDAAGIADDDVGWSRDLQRCHDGNRTPAGMERSLRAFAAEHSLTIPA